MKLYITNSSGTYNITELVKTVTWSGSYQQCARTLAFELVSDINDKNIPNIDCSLGAAVQMTNEGQMMFSGYIFSRTKATGDSLIDITCFDKGIYLKRNEAVYKFNTTPEAAVKRICADFGIKVGSIATTKKTISRKFIGVKLFDIILTMYTLASEDNGKKYTARFEGDSFNVIERSANSVLTLDGCYNLMDATTTESAEEMINQVAIYDSNDKLINTFKDNDNIKQFGLLQSYLKQSDEDVSKKAKKLLTDNGITQKITVNNLGDIKCISGNAVIVKEPNTNVCGLFYIDSDVHTWKNGQYYNKLVLNFKQIMSEKSSGSDK